MDALTLERFRLLGLTGLAGSALLLVADLLLVYAPLPAARFNIFTAAVGKSEARLIYGSLLGVFVIPLVLAGFGHIYLALRPAGPWLAAPPAILGIFAYVIGAGFHAAIPFYLAAIQAAHAQDASASPLLTLMARVFVPLQRTLLLFVAAASVWLFVSLLSGKSLYPRWTAAVSPLVLVCLSRAIIRVSPPAVAGVLIPAGNNLSMLVFIACSLFVVGSRA
jgi:hypothetical protein